MDQSVSENEMAGKLSICLNKIVLHALICSKRITENLMKTSESYKTRVTNVQNQDGAVLHPKCFLKDNKAKHIQKLDRLFDELLFPKFSVQSV